MKTLAKYFGLAAVP